MPEDDDQPDDPQPVNPAPNETEPDEPPPDDFKPSRQSCCSECNCSGYAETTPIPTMKCKNCGHASASHSC